VEDGELKVWTGEGFERTMNALTRADSEWRKIRQRSMDGKAEKRAEGRHVDGNQTLPPALRFGKRTGWSYDEAELARVERVYKLLFEDRHSLSEIARQTGYAAASVVRQIITNPTWRGVRAHPATADRDAFETVLPLKPLLTPDQWALAQEAAHVVAGDLRPALPRCGPVGVPVRSNLLLQLRFAPPHARQLLLLQPSSAR
jgi:hypothetical protein